MFRLIAPYSCSLGLAIVRSEALLKREELDAEVAELVVERLPIGDEIVVGLRLLRRLEVGLRPLVNRDFGVLALGEPQLPKRHGSSKDQGFFTA